MAGMCDSETRPARESGGDHSEYKIYMKCSAVEYSSKTGRQSNRAQLLHCTSLAEPSGWEIGQGSRLGLARHQGTQRPEPTRSDKGLTTVQNCTVCYWSCVRGPPRAVFASLTAVGRVARDREGGETQPSAISQQPAARQWARSPSPRIALQIGACTRHEAK